MVHSLGSHTSGVDGSSEGGRINTINIPGALVIYGVALLQFLQRRNPKTKLGVQPVLVNGILCLELSYEGEQPVGAPERWHGHRVVLKKVEAPPPPPAPAPLKSA
ncbi:MAG TPA: hypothetical protein VJR46_09880 [Candidatus Dormibacteraeota bacterium]|nr:hypothetical protein [Candidatus Dormibacteraeota bacterium]